MPFGHIQISRIQVTIEDEFDFILSQSSSTYYVSFVSLEIVNPIGLIDDGSLRGVDRGCR